MTRRVIAAALLAASAASPAEYLSGADLVELCARHGVQVDHESDRELVRDITDTATCRGYLMGAMDALAAGTEVCRPATTTIGEVLDLLAEWARRNPDELQGPATQAVAAALLRAFPCPSGAPPAARNATSERRRGAATQGSRAAAGAGGKD
jgi:hypothetical protein